MSQLAALRAGRGPAVLLPGCRQPRGGASACRSHHISSKLQQLLLCRTPAGCCQRRIRCSASIDETDAPSSSGAAPAAPEAGASEPSESIQSIREARLQPLKIALQDAIALHTKATGVREALEAEVCALFERAINAEGTDMDLDQVAAAAMAAVESAVKDEVEAATVESATQAALAKTLQDLQAISGEPVADETAAEMAAVLASMDASSAAPPAALASLDAKAAERSAADAILLLDSLTGSAPAAAGSGPAAAAAAAGALLQSVDGSGAAPSSNGSGGGGSATAAASPAPSSAAASAAPSPTPSGAAAAAAVAASAQEAKQAQAAAMRARLLQVAGMAVAVAVSVAFLRSPGGEALASAVNGLTASIAQRIGPIHIGEPERLLLETIWLLLTSIICVPAVCKFIPGGSPVLGYLIGGALVGPHALNIIGDVHGVSHLAELGVVFLLFNIGLELSLERLQSMAKYVFGMGAAQVVLTLLGVALFAVNLAHLPGPSAIILGGALAMSTTAVAIQVLEDRGEMGSRHGRATFSVLLFQDLAVVVLLMLIPLLAPDPSGAPGAGGIGKIATALGIAAVKAVLAIVGITAGGRLLIRPLYKKISNLANAEIFAATTLLVVLGTSFMTQLAGLSLALGAFLAGLLLAETEYALQVESDIAPYKGLLMGLFFMTVGMQISVQLFVAKWKLILASIVVLITGKLAVMLAAGQMFGLSRLASLRSGMLLATGGEFAFVAFGEAVSKGVLPGGLTGELYMVVALSMALVPYLAALGGKLGGLFERSDMKALQPQEDEVKELRNHVIIAGYGRVGQIIASMLSELLIPFVALDVRSDRVAAGKASDLPIYFGDAGSPAVLHSVGAERAACAVITLDTPGANYRSVWAMHKHFPTIKTYVRAHDINHGINLEKAGATVVVPETLEPSMQLAASVLSQFKLPPEEINTHLDNFRKKHLSELQALAALSGTTLGYLAPKKKDEEKLSATATIDLDDTVAKPVASPTPA